MGKYIIWNCVELKERRPVVRDTPHPCWFIRKRVIGVEHFTSWQPGTIQKVVRRGRFDKFKLDVLLDPRNTESVSMRRTLICPGRPLGNGCNFASSTVRLTRWALDCPAVTAALVDAARTIMRSPRMP